jgi:hypothetical protein
MRDHASEICAVLVLFLAIVLFLVGQLPIATAVLFFLVALALLI